jgi:glucan 1,3-beta-glucosidase
VSSTKSSSSLSSSSSTITTTATTTTSISTTTTTTTTTTSSAPAQCTDFWLEKTTHQGSAPFAPKGYKVFRNVKDFGAYGDGVHDDTAAINNAISSGGRCGPADCRAGSTTTPALVYFPAGTYLVSAPIVDYYYTQLIGNAQCLPTLRANTNFTYSQYQQFLLDGDQYQGTFFQGTNQGFKSTNVFWRQIANLVIDISTLPSTFNIGAIHWPTAQATSIQNVVVRASASSDSIQVGLLIEDGSGGYMGDLTFYGGAPAMSVGNQQFTMRNITINNALTGIQQLWDWGWTYKGVNINNCVVGFDLSAGSVTSMSIIDSAISNTATGIKLNTTLTNGDNIVLENVAFNSIAKPLVDQNGNAISWDYSGSNSFLVDSYIKGTGFVADQGPSGNQFYGPVPVNGKNPSGYPRPASLLAGGEYYERSKPYYPELPVSQFLSAKSAAFGAKGDAVTDDSEALNALFAASASTGKVAFVDAGIYLVKNTVLIPAGAKVWGEAFPVIMSSGEVFNDASNPQVVVAVGNGLSGAGAPVEWSNMIVSTQGQQQGAILIQWQLATAGSVPSGAWDVHTRIGGFAGSNLQVQQCPTTPNTAGTVTAANFNGQNCIAAFMSMHITAGASNIYIENAHLWTADHDADDVNLNDTQITIYTGRGLLIESQLGPIWLVGTAVEHHALYQYYLNTVGPIFMGLIQTETAYYQPNPDATFPFSPIESWSDPVYEKGDDGLGLIVRGSSQVEIYGAGLYSFFNAYSTTCSNQGGSINCQKRILYIDADSSINLYNLVTVGVSNLVNYAGTDYAAQSGLQDGFVETLTFVRTGAAI